MKLSELIMTLSAIPAPSGFEERAAEFISEVLRPFADEVRKDTVGNIIAIKKCGIPGAKRIAISAHMDEVGLIITGYEGAYLKFTALGGIDPRTLPAGEVRILAKQALMGVVCTMPPHILSAQDMEKAVPMDKLYIDAGLSQEKAEELIPLGTPAVFAGITKKLGPSRICGKALDNRACVAVTIKAFERICSLITELDVYLLISVQEELGRRGATAGIFSIDPDYAVVLDATFGHTPDSQKSKTLELGAGPAIGVGPNMNRALSDLLIKLAREKGIPYQIEVLPGDSGTDAAVIQISRQGVRTALISLPVKYMHSPAELAEIADAKAAADLLTEFVVGLREEDI